MGFFIMLQENTEGGFQIYLHTDNEGILSEEEIETMNEYGLDIWNEKKSWEAIQRILWVYVYDNRVYPFTELNKDAKRVAVKEFIVDHDAFFKKDENEKHRYDCTGVLISNGGMY